jgi:hypothetical protein
MGNIDVHELVIPDLMKIRPLMNASRYKPYRFFSKGIEAKICDFWHDRIQKSITQENSKAFVADFQNNPIGFVVVNDLPWDSQIFQTKMAIIDELVVNSEENNPSEFTYALLEKVEISLRNDGYQFILIKINTDDMMTIHQLEYSGFLLVDTMLAYCLDFRKNTFNKISRPDYPEDIIFRNATLKDEFELMELARVSFQNHFGRYHSDPRIPHDRAIEVYVQWMKSCISGYADFFIVAEIKGRIAGLSIWKKASQLEKNLPIGISHYNLGAIHPDFAGRGLFSFLTYEGMKLFQGKTDIIEGPTHVNNYPVQRGYTRLGWQICDARHSFHKWLD